jgi:serine/threonine protein phosphatase PrpC
MRGPIDRESAQQGTLQRSTRAWRADRRRSTRSLWARLRFAFQQAYRRSVDHLAGWWSSRTLQDADFVLSVGSRCSAGVHCDANQDRCYADPYHRMFVVADGVGGHAGGERASQAVVEVVASHLGKRLSESAVSLRLVENSLRETIQLANHELIELAQRNRDLNGMSSTATIGVIYRNRLLICHVGDSRAYLFRDRSLRQLTNDDTLVQGLVATDTLTIREASRHPMRQLLMHSLGTWPLLKELRVDTHRLAAGDRLLFTTDGLTDVVTRADLQRLLEDHAEPQAAANCLIEYAELAGSEGNATCIVVDLVSAQ